MSAEKIADDNSNSDEVAAHLGETLEALLNFDSWSDSDNLGAIYSRLENQVQEAVNQQGRVNHQLYRRVLPLLASRPSAPKGAGLYQVSLEELKWTHHNLLFNGATLAADGTVVAHDTLLMTVAQIGVCIVNYQGNTREFKRQLFQRDVRLTEPDPVEEMAALLEERQSRAALGYSEERDALNELVRRGLMAYGERGLLLEAAHQRWAMGHGTPVPRELLANSLEPLLVRSMAMLQQLILQHQKFIYVPSAPRERLILTLGEALGPLEFLIIDTLYETMQRWVGRANYSVSMGRQVRRFVEEVGPKIVRGVYRVSPSSPAQVFYAHVDHAQEAALIAMADSTLQEHRGFPMLLAMADNICSASFDSASFRAVVQQSYAKTGHPFRYQIERDTR
jgi:hypothetical protein